MLRVSRLLLLSVAMLRPNAGRDAERGAAIYEEGSQGSRCEKLEEERAAKAKKVKTSQAAVDKQNSFAPVLVGSIGAASFIFSLPFFYKNLARLFLRFASVVNKDIKESDYKKG